MTTTTPSDWEGVSLPAGFVDPRDNPDLPAITHYDPDQPDPVPPAARLEQEPVEVSTHPALLPRGSTYRCAIPGINLDAWSPPSSRGWGQSCNVQLARVQLTEAAISANAVLAELVWLVMAANEKQGYRYRRADTGCYNCRSLRVGTDWSWHAWALAIDSNWTTNPMRYPVVTDRPRWEIERWNRYGFGWGGDYDPTNPPDTMHTEFHGTPEQAQQALDLARRELIPIINGGNQPAPTPGPSDGFREIDWGGVTELNTKGDQVKKDQTDLIDTGFAVGPSGADGYAGQATVDAIKAFQFAARIGVDGAMGPTTRSMVHKVPSFHGDGLGNHSLAEWINALQSHGWRISDGSSYERFLGILVQFQRDKGITADGHPGPQSWTCLFCTVN